jgi:hypothetical protein
VLEEFMGIPIHPLLVHAPVVLVPLLALLAIAYAVAPFVRPHTRWVLGLLALGTPIAALLAKLSGDAFFGRLQRRNEITPDYFPKIEAHRHFGTMTVYATAVLGLLTLALVFLVAPRAATRRGLSMLLAVLTVVAAGVSLYYVIRTGDLGAKLVWTGR